MIAQTPMLSFAQAHSLSVQPMSSSSHRPQPLSIDQWLKDIGRRALVMTNIALRHHDVSQDIVQDSLLAFISRYAAKPSNEWTPLFYTILRSQIMDYKRKQARRSKWLTWFSPNNDDDDDAEDPMSQIATETDENPETLLARVNDITTVQHILSQLPNRQQEAFLYRAWEGLDIKTTADIMGCSESSVKTHYTRALQALRHGLQEPV